MASPSPAKKTLVLMEKYKENMEILQSKFTNSITTLKKNKIWEEIAEAVNTREKWKNLTSTAKKEFSGFKKEQKKMGGGPAPSNPTEVTLKIIDMFSETPSFTGLQGFETDLPKVLCLNSFFYKKLASCGAKWVLRWTKKINIFDYNKIFIPIHLPGHWALGVVDLCLKTITYWDSLHTSVDDAFFGDVRCFLKEEGARRGQVFQQEDWSNQIAKDIPHQQNDYDCGMVLCMESGWCGRDGKQGDPILLYNGFNGKVTDAEMKINLHSTTCQRQFLLKNFAINNLECPPGHSCCDICANSCQCLGSYCEMDLYLPVGNSEEEAQESTISDEQLLTLKKELNAL
ncbi:hypothetical protein ACROYT_G014327 [Oculina patagonica]